MKRQVVIMFLTAMVLSGCGKGAEAPREVPREVPKVETVSEEISEEVRGVVKEGFENTLADTEYFMSLGNPAEVKRSFIKFTGEGTDFNIVGVDYDGEKGDLCFSGGEETLVFKADEVQPKVYFIPTEVNGVCQFRIEYADGYSEAYEYGDSGFKLTDDYARENEVAFEL